MGRTYRYEKEWGRPRKKNKKNKRGKKQKPLNNTPHEVIDEDEREVTAYEEEIIKRYSNKPVGGF